MKKTFIVQIFDGQNATWQGTIEWTGENKKQSFRSALELIRLIDSTMDGSKAPDWEAAE